MSFFWQNTSPNKTSKQINSATGPLQSIAMPVKMPAFKKLILGL
jgi:hypothetical protein